MGNKCPCCSNLEYEKCCGLYLSGLLLPETPEQLMRSRYTAYSIVNIDYIIATMCGNASNGYNKVESRIWAENVTWQKLEVLSSQLFSAIKGFVEFKAYFKENGQPYILHEKSEFAKINGKWFYVDGVIFD